MKWLIFLLIITIAYACNSKNEVGTAQAESLEVNTIENVVKSNSSTSLIDKTRDITYDSLLSEVKLIKGKLRANYYSEQIDLDSVSRYFTDMLVKQVFPYWKGTNWDFNGHTDIPKNGAIACGYFVSTPLKHAGLRLNRFKLAQQASLNIVKSLAIGNGITSYQNPVIGEMITDLKSNLENGLYVVGLSNHVGFLYFDGLELYFIHSSFVEPAGVVAEIAAESMPFIYSNVFYITNISNNKNLMEKWLKGSALTIIGV